MNLDLIAGVLIGMIVTQWYWQVGLFERDLFHPKLGRLWRRRERK